MKNVVQDLTSGGGYCLPKDTKQLLANYADVPENLILPQKELYFYKNESSTREIDVIIQKDGEVVPIEIKSGNTRANSLKSLMKNHEDIHYGYKFIDGNIGVSEENIFTLPLYMAAFI